MIVLLLLYLLTPAVTIWLCRKVKFFNKIGPILLLYLIGVIIGNIPVLPEGASALQNILTSSLIPLAIPMLLFGMDLSKFSAKKSLMTLLCGVVAVLVTVVAGFAIFKNGLGAEGPKIGGMLTGVYIGGTPNLAALKLILGVRDETYILLNSYDMIVSFAYMVFLMTFGIKLLRKFLPVHNRDAGQKDGAGKILLSAEPDPYTGIFKRKNIKQVIAGFFISLIIIVVSFGLTFLTGGGMSLGVEHVMNGKYFMAVMILSLTTLGIATSFVKPVRKLRKSYDGGMYLIYIFSIVVASMADFSNLDLRGGISMFMYIVFAIFTSLVVQALLSKIFKVDADNMVISSVALINSAPFVPMMAEAMKNKDVLVTGLTIGIIGYATGNYLGFIIAELLHLI